METASIATPEMESRDITIPSCGQTPSHAPEVPVDVEPCEVDVPDCGQKSSHTPEVPVDVEPCEVTVTIPDCGQTSSQTPEVPGDIEHHDTTAPLPSHAFSLISLGEFVSECEVSYEAGRDLEKCRRSCTKKAEHKNFFSIKEFLDPAKGLCDPDHMDIMRRIADRTVKITINAVSEDRPDVYAGTEFQYPYSDLKGKTASRYGTGFITKVRLVRSSAWPLCAALGGSSKCQCKNCQESPNPESKYYKIVVRTACHVVYDDKEAQDCVVHLFYDSEDSTGVKKIHGTIAWYHRSHEHDMCKIKCYTHDTDLVERLGMGYNGLRDLYSWFSTDQTGWIISHPHGLSKHVSKGIVHLVGRSWRGAFPPENEGTAYRKLFKQDSTAHIATGLFGFPRSRQVKVPQGTRLVFPDGFGEAFHQKVCEVRHRKWNEGNRNYLKPPADTKIENLEGEQAPLHARADISVSHLMDHLLYSISTCPGSSGAPIVTIRDNGEVRVSWWLCHSGCEKGVNRSSFRNYLLPKRRKI